MKTFKDFIIEGGNVKVKTEKGEVSAAPFKVKNRSEQAGDVHQALSDIHDSMNKEHGIHLFGKGKKALNSGSLYAGSTRQFMNKDKSKISDAEFKKHKPSVGDLDVQIPAEHKETLTSHLTPGKKFGKYTVVGTKKHGNEVSAIMRHDNGEHHQFDFEGVHYHQDEPSKGEQLLHNSSWEDTKAGIKGLHHKILLNAVGGSTHKFSITHGLRSRTDESDKGTNEPEKITNKLFGQKADHSKIESFHGVTELIKKHIPKERHQEIYDKFKSGLEKIKGVDHGPALAHLRQHLGVKDSVNEETEQSEQHASVIPMVGFSPISHMGHAKDLGKALKKLPGSKHIGISSKADAFAPEERKDILSRQWGDKENHVHIVGGAGESIRKAYDSMKGKGRKVLHILVGHDRKDFAHGLKKSLESGKIKEMGDNKFDEIQIHHPEDTDRSHGMSGTRMRAAANQEGSVAEKEFHNHLGPMFSREESNKVKNKIKAGIQSGQIPLKRK